ncbi:MAG: aconitate hydratase, partial [Verrucomicrobiales bacterium]
MTNGRTLTHKLIEAHLLRGKMVPGEGIALEIDQTLTQDATGTLVMLEFEAMGIPRVKTEISVQYVDHNIIQEDFKNPDDHLFLHSACEKFGLWFSPAGNGVSHPVHMERFGIPGKTLVGSDSHTPAAGALGMFSLGAGGVEVAMAMAGHPLHLSMPEVWGVHLTGELPDWVSAKDVILEMLRRHGVSGGKGRVIEYFGSGLQCLSAMDRHVIANMGTELGATSTVFPSDDVVSDFLRQQGRAGDFVGSVADDDAAYDVLDEIDLSKLEPLVALPSSPGDVVTVKSVEGRPIYQAYVGSSANPGLRDFAVAAQIVAGKQIPPQVSFDINPSSRQVLENLIELGHLGALIQCGARLHQAGCNGCIGMGQAPATGKISMRTVPRNFPGRSGTIEDQVYLCSPETAAASALRGMITDPRSLDMDYPSFVEPHHLRLNTAMLVPPLPEQAGQATALVKGPNIKSLPQFDPLPDELDLPILLKLGDDVSTDEILPAGTRVLPYRSNIPEIAKFVFADVDRRYHERALENKEGGSMLVAGSNYGQGSSREHAALAPRFLGVRVVVAKSFARIHLQNLANFGILPLTFVEPSDYDRLSQGAILRLSKLGNIVENPELPIMVELPESNETISLTH